MGFSRTWRKSSQSKLWAFDYLLTLIQCQSFHISFKNSSATISQAQTRNFMYRELPRYIRLENKWTTKLKNFELKNWKIKIKIFSLKKWGYYFWPFFLWMFRIVNNAYVSSLMTSTSSSSWRLSEQSESEDKSLDLEGPRNDKSAGPSAIQSNSLIQLIYLWC